MKKPCVCYSPCCDSTLLPFVHVGEEQYNRLAAGWTGRKGEKLAATYFKLTRAAGVAGAAKAASAAQQTPKTCKQCTKLLLTATTDSAASTAPWGRKNRKSTTINPSFASSEKTAPWGRRLLSSVVRILVPLQFLVDRPHFCDSF